jgi:hypothetical protein
MKIAQLTCLDDVVIYGRHENGDPDHCFTKNTKYLFCLDEKKNNIFTINDVEKFHIFPLSSDYTATHFEVNSIDTIEDSPVDEVTLQRMKRIYKDRHNFEE